MDSLFGFLFFISIIALVIGLLKPNVFSRFLKERATRKGTAAIFGIAAIVFFVLRGVTTDTDTSSTTNQNNQLAQQNLQAEQEAKSQAESVDYDIIESEDQSHKALGNRRLSDFTAQEISALPTDKKMAYRVVVSPEIKENQVRPTIEKIISDITSQDNDIDEISLLLYSDKELVNGAYDVAMATWAPNGKLGNITPEVAANNDRSSYGISFQAKKNLEDYLQKRGLSEERFGLTEDERRKFFKEIVAAEDSGRDEAEKIYPIDISNPNYKQENIMKNIDKERELSEKYKAGVRKKYGVTEDIQTKITTEAFEEGWALE